MFVLKVLCAGFGGRTGSGLTGDSKRVAGGARTMSRTLKSRRWGEPTCATVTRRWEKKAIPNSASRHPNPNLLPIAKLGQVAVIGGDDTSLKGGHRKVGLLGGQQKSKVETEYGNSKKVQRERIVVMCHDL